jgi:hypothetical protein
MKKIYSLLLFVFLLSNVFAQCDTTYTVTFTVPCGTVLSDVHVSIHCDTISTPPADTVETTLLILAWGQSPMDGSELISNFPSYLTGPLEGCKVLKTTAFETLDAGVNNKLNVTSQKAGLELSLMKTLHDSLGEDVFMCKSAYSGTQMYKDSTLIDWHPTSTGEYFDISNARDKIAIDLLIADGKIPSIVILGWQGENDYTTNTKAVAYQTNLTAFAAQKVAYVTNYISTTYPEVSAQMPPVKFVFHEVLTVLNGNNTILRNGQVYVGTNNQHYSIRRNTGIETNDTIHPNAAGYIFVGIEDANHILNLIK